MSQVAVARMWRGRTTESLADDYQTYLHEHGVKKLRATKGNLGVQVFRRAIDGVVEFTTISYWPSRRDVTGCGVRPVSPAPPDSRDPASPESRPRAV